MAKKPAKVTDDRISKIMAASEKDFKASGFRKLNGESDLRIERASTGCVGIDWALTGSPSNGWGFPRGRIIEVFGAESSAKTTLCLEHIAREQQDHRVCAFLDAEHALDPRYAKGLGVDLEQLLFCQPDSGEEALQLVELCCLNGADTVVIDSVANLIPKAELNGEIGDSHVGLQARLMSQALRKLVGVAEQSNTTLIFINQIREKIGMMFGNPETTPGGRALKFHCSVRVELKRIGAVKVHERNVGNRTRLKVVKNKVGCPFREVEFDVLFGSGIDQIGNAVDLAVESGAITMAGGWFTRKGLEKVQGRPAMIALLAENLPLYQEIRLEILEHKERMGI